MNSERAHELLRNAEYKTAKSLDIPHSYTLKYSWKDINEFYELVQFIRDHGVKERFWSKEYIYYYLDGYKYWTMGYELPVTKLINKAKA